MNKGKAETMKPDEIKTICDQLRQMSLDNWLGSVADRTRIAAAALSALSQFQHAGFAVAGEPPSEVHEDLSEFVLDHHPSAGDPVIEVMPVWVGKPQWTVSYCVGDEGDQWEEVELYDTKEEADAAHAKNQAEIANLEPV